jgi:hypothetical protein
MTALAGEAQASRRGGSEKVTELYQQGGLTVSLPQGRGWVRWIALTAGGNNNAQRVWRQTPGTIVAPGESSHEQPRE